MVEAKPIDTKDGGADQAKDGEDEQIVTPWNVSTTSEKGIDYDKLIRDYGCNKITDETIARIEKITGERAHRFIRRGIFFCQRDLDVILNAYEKK